MEEEKKIEKEKKTVFIIQRSYETDEGDRDSYITNAVYLDYSQARQAFAKIIGNMILDWEDYSDIKINVSNSNNSVEIYREDTSDMDSVHILTRDLIE